MRVCVDHIGSNIRTRLWSSLPKFCDSLAYLFSTSYHGSRALTTVYFRKYSANFILFIASLPLLLPTCPSDHLVHQKYDPTTRPRTRTPHPHRLAQPPPKPAVEAHPLTRPAVAAVFAEPTLGPPFERAGKRRQRLFGLREQRERLVDCWKGREALVSVPATSGAECCGWEGQWTRDFVGWLGARERDAGAPEGRGGALESLFELGEAETDCSGDWLRWVSC